jgi:hypothetical protein
MMGPNLATSARNGIDLSGPLARWYPNNLKFSMASPRISLSIDMEKQTVICLAGFFTNSNYGWEGINHRLYFFTVVRIVVDQYFQETPYPGIFYPHGFIPKSIFATPRL